MTTGKLRHVRIGLDEANAFVAQLCKPPCLGYEHSPPSRALCPSALGMGDQAVNHGLRQRGRITALIPHVRMRQKHNRRQPTSQQKEI